MVWIYFFSSILGCLHFSFKPGAGELCAATVIPFWELFWSGKKHFIYKLRSTGSKVVLYEWVWREVWLLATGYWLVTGGYWLLAGGYWLLATGWWLLATG